MDYALPSTQKDVKNILNGATKGLEEKFDDTAHIIRNKISDEKKMATNMYSDFSKMAQKNAKKSVEYTTEFIKENPMASALGAAAVGITIGYLIARRP